MENSNSIATGRTRYATRETHRYVLEQIGMDPTDINDLLSLYPIPLGKLSPKAKEFSARLLAKRDKLRKQFAAQHPEQAFELSKMLLRRT